MSLFESQNNLSRELLSKQDTYVVFKTTRAGATTSLAKNALEMDLRVVILTPNKRMGQGLIESITKLVNHPVRTTLAGSNTDLCPKVKKLKMVFQFRGKCKKCAYKGKPDSCPFQSLLIDDFDLLMLTYSKLDSLIKSNSVDSKALLQKLALFDVVIFDEFTTAVLPRIQTIALVTTDKENRRETLRETLKEYLPDPQLWSFLTLSFIMQFEETRSGVYQNTIMQTFNISNEAQERILRDGWRAIINLTKKEIDTQRLQHIFLAMFSKKVVVANEDGNVTLTASPEDALDYLKKFREQLGTEKHIFIVDAYQPTINFSSIFGDYIPILWGDQGDPLKTNDQQLIIADTYHWGVRDFFKDSKHQEQVRQYIKQITNNYGFEKTLIIATNKKMANAISEWLPEEYRAKYYRCDSTRGIQAKGKRVLIQIGGPYLPKTAYVPQSKSFKPEDFMTELDLLESPEDKAVQLPKILKLDDMRGEYVNCIGRVKDPEGKERSLVFCLGMQQSEVRGLLKDNSAFKLSQPRVTKTLLNGGLEDEGMLIGQMWMDCAKVEPKHLSIVARIICEAIKKKTVAASQVVPMHTEYVKLIAKKYKEVIEHYGVSVVAKTGGMAFMAVIDQ